MDRFLEVLNRSIMYISLFNDSAYGRLFDGHGTLMEYLYECMKLHVHEI